MESYHKTAILMPQEILDFPRNVKKKTVHSRSNHFYLYNKVRVAQSLDNSIKDL